MAAGPPTLLALSHARVITPSEEMPDATVMLQDGRIVGVDGAPPPSTAEVIDAAGRIVAPGLIDLHVHGGGGFSLVDGDPAQIGAYARWAASRGVTGFLVTLLPDGRMAATIEAALPAIGAASGGAQALGLNFEGPFLNPSRCGAIRREHLRPPDVDEFRHYVDAAKGNLRVMTIAPELPDTGDVIAAALDAGVVVALGHSDATYEEAERAFALGVRHVTHCFNAMRPFHHRDPGCLGAALTARDVSAELIADGAHVHPAAMEMLLRLKGVENVVLVSDGVAPAGLGDGEFDLQGQRLHVQGGVARLEDGALAGSVAPMDAMVRNAASWLPVTTAEAIRMATLNPASVIGLADRKGRVAPGYDADLVVLSSDLEVQMTFVAGALVYRREG